MELRFYWRHKDDFSISAGITVWEFVNTFSSPFGQRKEEEEDIEVGEVNENIPWRQMMMLRNVSHDNDVNELTLCLYCCPSGIIND